MCAVSIAAAHNTIHGSRVAVGLAGEVYPLLGKQFGLLGSMLLVQHPVALLLHRVEGVLVSAHVYKWNLRLKMQFVGNLQQGFAAGADASVRGCEHSGQFRDRLELRHIFAAEGNLGQFIEVFTFTCDNTLHFLARIQHGVKKQCGPQQLLVTFRRQWPRWGLRGQQCRRHILLHGVPHRAEKRRRRGGNGRRAVRKELRDHFIELLVRGRTHRNKLSLVDVRIQLNKGLVALVGGLQKGLELVRITQYRVGSEIVEEHLKLHGPLVRRGLRLRRQKAPGLQGQRREHKRLVVLLQDCCERLELTITPFHAVLFCRQRIIWSLCCAAIFPFHWRGRRFNAKLEMLVLKLFTTKDPFGERDFQFFVICAHRESLPCLAECKIRKRNLYLGCVQILKHFVINCPLRFLVEDNQFAYHQPLVKVDFLLISFGLVFRHHREDFLHCWPCNICSHQQRVKLDAFNH
mmetsp:Transcript_4119/g.6881  ORF Transcript_4119/g.6881 Transcript_4119/m.6881 type:complete len:461 (+) Transcript_4119:695-2077(+)